jgi:hypothetical protein
VAEIYPGTIDGSDIALSVQHGKVAVERMDDGSESVLARSQCLPSPATRSCRTPQRRRTLHSRQDRYRSRPLAERGRAFVPIRSRRNESSAPGRKSKEVPSTWHSAKPLLVNGLRDPRFRLGRFGMDCALGRTRTGGWLRL